MKKPGYVLDSYALLAYLQGEPGGLMVKDLLKKAEAGKVLAFLSLINLGEIIYIIARKRGGEVAKEIQENLLRLPIQLAEVTLDRVMASAHLKARHSISYADAFAASLAKELGGTLVTGDPEFKVVEDQITVLWV